LSKDLFRQPVQPFKKYAKGVREELAMVQTSFNPLLKDKTDTCVPVTTTGWSLWNEVRTYLEENS